MRRALKAKRSVDDLEKLIDKLKEFIEELHDENSLLLIKHLECVKDRTQAFQLVYRNSSLIVARLLLAMMEETLKVVYNEEDESEG